MTVPLHATLVPGSERNVTAPVPDVAAFDQGGGQLATDGDAFLAVWVDRTLSGVGDIHGARVSPDGNRIDDEALHIAVTDEDESRVAVAWGGNRYLAVWSTPTALRARFVGNNAAMSDAIVLAEVTELTQPQIAFNGQMFLVVWPAGAVFRGALLGVDGQLVKTFDVASTAQTFSETGLVAANGAFHFVTAITDFNGVPNDNGYPSDIGVTAIDATGVVATRTVVAPATTPVFDLRATSSATEILIAWSTARAIPGGMVRSVRVTAAGAGAVDSVPADGMYLQDAAAWGNVFLLVYGTAGPKLVYLPGVNTPISFLPIHLGESLVIDSASNSARTLLLVRGLPRAGFEYGPAGGDVYVMRVETNASLEPLSVAPRHQSSPDIAAAGDLRLAAWCEYIGDDRRLSVVVSRLDAANHALSLNGIDLGAYANHPTAPRVASNGTDWLVVWVEGTNLYGSRVANNGTRLDTLPFLITSHLFENSDLAVSWDGTQYVVVYFRGEFRRGLRTTPHASRVTSQGTLAAPEMILSAEAANEFPTIASGPDGSLIVWRSGLNLAGTLLSPSGTKTPLAFPSTHPAGPRPAIAWNNGTFLVAAPFRGPFGDQIQWQRVSNTGVVQTPLSTFLDIEATLIAGGGYPSLELEAHGDGFLLFWNGVANHAQQRSASVYAARIGTNSILAEGPTFVGTTLADNTPSIGASGNTIVYSRKIGHATRETARVYAREVHDVSGKPRRRAVR
ncbi:MAG: hypothetical protein M3P06_07620 [Acidobacteriota bacterium]|nr:hypothetical protein [Acidobacteriota bacterium]